MDMSEMMKRVQQMTGRVGAMQNELKQKTVEGMAGGGMVKAKMNGAGDLIGLEIEKDVVDPEDPEMLADLILAAVGAARKQVQDLRAEQMKQMTGGLDLSSLGIDLPDMG